MGQIYYRDGRQYTAAQLKELEANSPEGEVEAEGEVKVKIEPKQTKAELRELIEAKAEEAGVELTESTQSFLAANKTTVAQLTEYLSNDNNFVLESEGEVEAEVKPEAN